MPTDPRFPARFDADPWVQDIERTSPTGRQAAQAARKDYETNGVPRSHLKPCESEGRDGTNLPNCAKVYLPQPDGRFGMVFTVDWDAGKPAFLYLAFGVRHHPRDSGALTVYQIARTRLTT